MNNLVLYKSNMSSYLRIIYFFLHLHDVQLFHRPLFWSVTFDVHAPGCFINQSAHLHITKDVTIDRVINDTNMRRDNPPRQGNTIGEYTNSVYVSTFSARANNTKEK